ncbi:hypothetical protein ACFYWY_09625 [Streptomyces sp. NPDC002870]|uniref:hypothetical protein n=1 Tax=Streptomyces sp. NPDC002870 TaxID=3364666 RepID=UPI0036A698A9
MGRHSLPDDEATDTGRSRPRGRRYCKVAQEPAAGTATPGYEIWPQGDHGGRSGGPDRRSVKAHPAKAAQ